jgi:hypothetical protein
MKTKHTLFCHQFVTVLMAATQGIASASCEGCDLPPPPTQSFLEIVSPGNGRAVLPSPIPSSHGFLPGYDLGKRVLGRTPSFRWVVDEQPVDVCQMASGTSRVFIDAGCSVWDEAAQDKSCTVVTKPLTNHQTIGNLVLACLNGVAR